MAAPATLVVFNIVRDSTGAGMKNVQVQCVLNGNNITVAATGDSMNPKPQVATTDGSGRYQFTVVGNDLLAPANTTYTIIEPFRTYDIAPQSANGATQQTTSVNVIVNTPTPLAPVSSNVTGPLTVQGALIGQSTLAITGATTLSSTLAVTGATELSGGLTVDGGITVDDSGITVTGNSTITGTANTLTVSNGTTSPAILGSTSGSFAGLQLTDTGGQGAGIKLIGNGGTPSKIVRASGGNFLVQNDANNASLISITDAGACTVLGGVGFYAHAVPAQPAAPVTLADVIAVIRGCGLSA